MSKYTTEVRYICETYANQTETPEYADINTVIETAAPQIFDTFPIYDEAYRIVLETKILRHYYTREICAETVGLWKFLLNNKMNEIMPYYNKLYESELIQFNPMYTIDITKSRTGTGTEDRTNEDNRTANKNGNESNNRNYEENEKNKNNKSNSSVNVTNYNSEENNKSNDNKIMNENKTKENNETNNETAERKENTIGSENGNTETIENNTNKNAFSDTPQGNLTGVDNNTYLTDYRKITENNNENSSTNKNTIANAETKDTKNGNKTNADNETNAVIENVNKNENNSDSGITNENAIENSNETNERNKNLNENENKIYSNAEKSNASQTGSIATTEQYLEYVKGKQGGESYSKMLSEFRKTFLNIDLMIINELADLFMQVY